MIDPQKLFLREDPDVPNNPALPVLVYREIIPRDAEGKDRIFRQRFQQSGWGGIWRDGIFSYHHFHPDAHEALGIASGWVDVQLGGDSGQRVRLEAGDLVVLPVGTGHRNLDASDDLVVIGAYPQGQENYTTLRSKREKGATPNAPRPDSDPFYGGDGSLTAIW